MVSYGIHDKHPAMLRSEDRAMVCGNTSAKGVALQCHES